MSDKFNVDFIGVGFPKCGTEWVAACLREHPEIDFSKHKETNYFMSSDHALGEYICKHVRAKSYKQYKNEFKNDGRIKGEFSVHYAYDENAIKGIKERFPKAKLLIVIRNPVDFLYSAYWFLRYSNAFYDIPDTFEKGLEEANKKYICRKEYAEFSKYIKNCLKYFSKENLLILTNDDIKNSPESTIATIYSFIGLSSDYIPPSLNERINETAEIRSPFVMKVTNILVKIIMKLNLGNILYDAINTENPVRTWYRRIVRKPKKYPKMSESTRKKLINEFVPEIVELEKILQRELSSWKK